MGRGGDVKANPIAVGARIHKIRTDKKLSGEEFGAMVDGVTKANVSKWEKGFCLPNRKRIGIIADIAGISVNELLNGKPEEVEAILSNFTTNQLLDEIKRRLNA